MDRAQPTFEEIINRAEGLGLPMAEFAFEGTRKNPVPDPPYIVYLRESNVYGHDTGNAIESISGSIELYTDRKPYPEWERRIESEVLFDINFEKQQAAIESERMVQTAYDFSVIQKRG